MKKVFLSNPLPKEELPALKEEFNERSGSLNAIGPVVPGSMFIVPTTELLEHENLNIWFPSFEEGEQFSELTPSIFPFDKWEYINECLTNSGI